MRDPLLKPQYKIDRDFARDIVDLFTECKYGHMEKWEYATPLYNGDPAAGIAHWTNLINDPGDYYLIEGDVINVQMAVQDGSFKAKLRGIKHMIELGPGCRKSLSQKTLRIIDACPDIQSYQVIDGTYDVAHGAAEFIGKKANLAYSASAQDYIQNPIIKAKTAKTALVFWGGSIGNFAGALGESPFSKLTKQLHDFQCALDNGDLVIISFDAEQDEHIVKRAYNEENLKKQELSPLFRAKREKIITGDFNPYMWHYVPTWVANTGQCAHTVYPVINQSFEVDGIRVYAPEGKHFISNNSYKYKPDMMTAAATMAGFTDISIIQHGSMALLVAEK